MIFEYVQLVLKPVLAFITGLMPAYVSIFLGLVAVTLAYLYYKVDPRSLFSTVQKGFIFIFGMMVFLLLEAILK